MSYNGVPMCALYSSLFIYQAGSNINKYNNRKLNCKHLIKYYNCATTIIISIKFISYRNSMCFRLYPLVTMNCRILSEDIVLNGYRIPKEVKLRSNE